MIQSRFRRLTFGVWHWPICVQSALMDRIARAATHVREAALAYPEAWEHHPWGDEVIKVRPDTLWRLLGDTGARLRSGERLN
jgi:hypothetical protein